MKDSGDAVPELIVVDERSKRVTAELCGDWAAHGLRCTLTKGHFGEHECLALRGPTRWDPGKAS